MACRTLALLATLALCCSVASAELVLVVFSDSLSDNGSHGNGSLVASDVTALKQVAATTNFSSHWNGRFSNGFNWNDYLLGQPFDRVVNYAYGGAGACPGSGAGGFSGASAAAPAAAPSGSPPSGAVTGAAPPSGGMPAGGMPGGGSGMEQPLSLVNQTARYLEEQQAALSAAGDDRIILVWIGGNDMRGALSQDAAAANATLDSMVACIEQSIRSLLDAGETRFAVGMPTFYSLGSVTAQEQPSWLAMQHAGADKLRPVLEEIRADYPGAAIEEWGVADAVEELTTASPPAFGFTNNTAACLEGGMGSRRRSLQSTMGSEQPASTQAAAALAYLEAESPVDGIITSAHCATPDTYTYWDSAHPTAAAHLYLARSFASFLAGSSLLNNVTTSLEAAQADGTAAVPSPSAASPTSAAALSGGAQTMAMAMVLAAAAGAQLMLV
ncbi:hypothetical protein ABPG75_007014 [Micractinium tetrahymenae]